MNLSITIKCNILRVNIYFGFNSELILINNIINMIYLYYIVNII